MEHCSDMVGARHRWSAILFTLLLLSSLLPTGHSEPEEDAFQRPESLIVKVEQTVPHDGGAYTQGLEFYQGRLFESTGLRGVSTLREVEVETGTVLRSIDLNETEFGEGITLVGEEIIQLTWQKGVAHRYRYDTFEATGNHTFDGEGWGLAFDGSRLIMSDGSDVLTYRNATTFEVEGTVNVTLNGEPLNRLNELEWYQGLLLANVYQSEEIVGIDSMSGVVVLQIDASGLKPEGGHVLNGIAWDRETDSLWITGKNWTEMHRISFVSPEPEPEPEIPEEGSSTLAEGRTDVWALPILGLLVLVVLALLAMNLKDGEPDPEDGGPAE
jgi:glutamine cyclotransferase